MKELQFYPLALLGNFQRYGVLRLGKFPNKLRYFLRKYLRRVGGLSAVALPRRLPYPYNPTLLFPPFGRETAPFRPCDGMTV